jgi:putative transposase
MRPNADCSVTAREVHERAVAVLQDHVRLPDKSPRCLATTVWSVLLFAAARLRSVHDACGRLRDVPCDDTVRAALVAGLPEEQELTRRLVRSLADGLPRDFLRRRQPLAVDLTLLPYHGEPFADPREVYRGEAQSGTTHFHAYATCCCVRRGRRFTVALCPVSAGTGMAEVVERLMRQAARVGVRPRYLLLDRQFYSVEVIRCLQAARCPFVVPAVVRGRKPRDPSRVRGLRALAGRKSGGWSEHTLVDARSGRKATTRICVVCRNEAGRRGRHGRKTLLYAVWGLARSARWVRETYRRRFGIESSYRQMNQVRVRTSTRRPLLRLLFVGVALVLRNVWAWLHLTVFARRRRGSLTLDLEAFRLGTLALCLQRVVAALFGCREELGLQPPPEPLLNAV